MPLITQLQANGISYLLGAGSSVGKEDEHDNPVCLLQRLAACHYPLVENACISLLILHAELAASLVEAPQHRQREIVENLAVITLATLSLQQWWLFPAHIRSSHGLRNEITANKQCCADWLHKQIWLHRLLADACMEIPPSRRKYICDKERSRTISFDKRISLRNPWELHRGLKTIHIQTQRSIAFVKLSRGLGANKAISTH
jgi:hypothetical protein